MSSSELCRKRFPDLRNKPDARVLVTFKRRPMGFLRPLSWANLKAHPTVRGELVIVDTSMIKRKAAKVKKPKASARSIRKK